MLAPDAQASSARRERNEGVMTRPFRHKEIGASVQGLSPQPGAPAIAPLGDADEPEVRAFLCADTVDTVVMSGLIADNGLESPFNRGTFYGCRDASRSEERRVGKSVD